MLKSFHYLGSVRKTKGLALESFSTGTEMVSYLKRVYEQSNLAQRYRIEIDIPTTSKRKSIQEYYAGFLTLWTK